MRVTLTAVPIFLVASIAAAAPVNLTPTQVQLRPGGGHPYLVAGMLSEASTQSAPDIARAYLASRPPVLAGADPSTLRVARVIELSSGSAVRLEQYHHGLQVIGGASTVRIDANGHVRWVASNAAVVPADLRRTATLPGAQALSIVASASGYDADQLVHVDADRATRLVVYTQTNMTPRLAYWVELPKDIVRLQTIRAFVDAETGFIYRRENLTKRGLPVCEADEMSAYVYETNPNESALQCKSFAAWLEPEATALENADVGIQNCIDNKNCLPVEVPVLGSINAHFCDRIPVAAPNEDGDFTDYVFESDTAPEDEFAEVQMFYHVNKVYEVARGLGGFTDLVNKPLTAIVNLRIPALDFASICTGPTYQGNASLMPFDNAAFVTEGSLVAGQPPEDSIVFGQGSRTDFSYDGDVIYHEFGHAVMATVAPQLSAGYIDEWGFNTTPGGMHEGYADLMTVFTTDDPEIGEYAGGLPGSPTAIRDLVSNATCPEALVGESHFDSLPLGAAMWQARSEIATSAEDKKTFDKAVFAAQQTFAALDNFTTAAAKTVAEMEVAFDAATAARVESIFSERGLDGCKNRVVSGHESRTILFVGGTDQVQVGGTVPAPIQFEYTLAEDALELKLNVAGSGAGGLSIPGMETSPNLMVAVKPDAPIRWTVGGGGASGDYSETAELTVNGGGTRSAVATIAGEFPAGTYYVQVLNSGPTWQLRNISLSHTAGTITAPDAGVGGGDGNGNGVDGDDDGSDDGCGCAAEADDMPGVFALVLAIAFAVRRVYRWC